MKIVLKIVGITIILFIITVAIFFKNGYQVNVTASYPMGIYKIYEDSKNINRNDMILFCPPDNDTFKMAKKVGYLRSGFCPGNYIKMMKKVSGLPGDKININKFVYVNSKKLINSDLYKKDSQDNILPELKENFILEDDQYFLMSDYDKKSFDSRYFGPINKKQLIGKMKPIFIF